MYINKVNEMGVTQLQKTCQTLGLIQEDTISSNFRF